MVTIAMSFFWPNNIMSKPFGERLFNFVPIDNRQLSFAE